MDTNKKNIIQIELLQKEHIKSIQKLANSSLISKTSSVPFPCTEKNIENRFLSNQKQNPIELTFVIKKNNKVVGSCTLKKINYVEKEAEISYWIGYEFWGNNIATKAVKQLIDYAFLKMELIQLNSHVLRDHNQPSLRILKRHGFIVDSDKRECPVEGRFQKDFPDDSWIFYKLPIETWIEISQARN